MIYIFYTSIALAAIVSIGTIKAQMAHIKGLKGMYKEESRRANVYNLTIMELRAELRSVQDIGKTWAKVAQETSDDLTRAMMQHAHEMEQMRAELWKAGEAKRKNSEYKKAWRAKRKANGIGN